MHHLSVNHYLNGGKHHNKMIDETNVNNVNNVTAASAPTTPTPTTNRRRSSMLDYEQSIMFGQYREDLANFALKQAEKIANLHQERQQNDEMSSFRSGGGGGGRGVRGRGAGICGGGGGKRSKSFKMIRHVFKCGGDMIFFSTLAITLATLSFVIDIFVHAAYEFRDYLTKQVTTTFITSFLMWIAYLTTMVLISAIITRLIAPQAAGSGVSEMKVVLRGVILKEYLNCKTLFAKVVGLAFTLGSGLPLGKEGPFVHISSMVANQYMKLFSNITDPKEYESRFFEVIAVACGLGVAVTFASPVGGVLYSIEIVSVFFSVRSYWHGFFAATVGALFWRLLSVWFAFEDSITHIFKTNFRLEHPYETLELFSYAFLGILAGLSSYVCVCINRQVVLLNRRKNRFNTFLQRYPLIYPTLMSLLVGIISYPGTFGQFYASWLSSEESMHEVFSNYSWHTLQHLVDHDEVIDHWRTPYTSTFMNLFLYFVMNLLLVSITATLPIPFGLIVPSFKIGAGLGRFYGECMTYLFPNGLNPMLNRTQYPILAGTYAVAGSAAFAGANTGALSSAVIAFEMTGQVTHLLPVMVSILAATITGRLLGPSIYDSIIILKKLPYLPSILPSSSNGHRIFVEDFMERDLLFVWGKCTYRYIRHILAAKQKLRIYPFVRSPESMILLGTVERAELQYLLDTHLSRQRMMHDIRKSLQSLNNCPVHGQQQQQKQQLQQQQQSRFQVSKIPEIIEDLEVTAVGTAAWEEEQLDTVVDFSNCPIDPAPFQLMEGTSLLKVHNLFSLLGLQLAYVTSLGTLVGVVSLKELRQAIENMNNGTMPSRRRQSSLVQSRIKPEIKEELEEDIDDDDEDDDRDDDDGDDDSGGDNDDDDRNLDRKLVRKQPQQPQQNIELYDEERIHGRDIRNEMLLQQPPPPSRRLEVPTTRQQKAMRQGYSTRIN